MELRDYLRMMRRGWPAVVLIASLFVGLASLYLAVAPKRYESTTALLVSASDPRTIGDLQQGHQFAVNASTTFADVVGSATVLAPVAADLRPQLSVDDLAAMITTAAPESTTLIYIVAAAGDAQRAADVANAVATSASRVLPALENPADGPPLVRVQQIRPAPVPVHAVSPNVKRILALGLVVGMCVGLAATITFQTLDTRIRLVDDIRKLTDVPLLAVLPHLKRAQRQGVVVREDPAGAVGEAFRSLRTNLRFLESKERRSLVFTAVSDDRDGAQVPVNLAWSLAQAGRRVLLVDLDMRQSIVGDTVGIRTGPGLADVLAGEAELSSVIYDTRHPQLRVVLSGTAQASPSDLLSAPMMTTVLRRMEYDHDFVIMHAPPLLAYSDAAVVSGTAGGTLVTISAGRTRAHELTMALGALANVWVRPVGLVLSGARRTVTLGKASGGDPRIPLNGPRHGGDPSTRTAPNEHHLPVVGARPPHRPTDQLAGASTRRPAGQPATGAADQPVDQPTNGRAAHPANGRAAHPPNGRAAHPAAQPAIGATGQPASGTVVPPTNGGVPPTNGAVPPADGGAAPPTSGGAAPPADGGAAPPANGASRRPTPSLRPRPQA